MRKAVVAILLVVYVSQIFQAVIMPNAIDVVHLAGWPFPVGMQPCEPRSAIKDTINADPAIPGLLNTARHRSRLDLPRRRNQPCENTGGWVVFQKLAKPYCVHNQ